ncbi:phosphoglucosamine mutase [Pelotomaculum terephthalicicum JT]|uniref:phosphoglucosamine mutase n=1 Tax=Pelotomaculum terephthalicicum TaxID=206393 RepID=UPI001F03759D|nr:phosphoglucosamine mutase [Pelotomaculum terephthalicicum]MCG9967422.1 phosphoglucosamine mutase [Pelotomaculum terephthalicicum JT]
MGKMFGTDGVRGVANRKLSPELAFKLGRAGAHVLARDSASNRMVIGKDTRISGDMLEAALVAGICSAGVDVIKLGVMPTPAIAYLTRDLKAAGGVVISASHNPVEDNGIKFFSASGYKLPDETEAEIEALVEVGCANVPCPTGGDVGRSRQLDDAADRYVEFAKDAFSINLKGLRIVVDCANGAAFQVAPRVFRELGAAVHPIFNKPDGININDGCGSTHPEVLMNAVVSTGADLGLAHDGDADRVLAVDAKGRLVDGDQMMVICARHLQEKGMLAENTVVVTVMSNLGLHLALRDSGIRVVETKVGDRYVLEELLRTGARFGGEQSGHIISLDHNTTGDGILTALHLLTVMTESGRPLDELASQMEQLPQLLENVQVEDKSLVMNSTVLAGTVNELEQELGGKGRILVRPSGTEPLVRVMAEGRDMQQLKNIVGRLVNLIVELK